MEEGRQEMMGPCWEETGKNRKPFELEMFCFRSGLVQEGSNHLLTLVRCLLGLAVTPTFPRLPESASLT